jgi:hypothetical protein
MIRSATITTLVLTFAAAVNVQAQNLSQYVLNDADMYKYNRAHDNLQRVAKAHPQLAHLVKMRADQLDRIAPNLESQPLLRKAVTDAGLTTQKYALINTVVLVVGIATLMETDAEAMALLREAGIRRENLEFFRSYARRNR